MGVFDSDTVRIEKPGAGNDIDKGSETRNPPSKILTAVGKSLTLRAARRAAAKTPTDGTRSYANALLRFRCHDIVDVSKGTGFGKGLRKHTWSSNTSCTLSNSFSYLQLIESVGLLLSSPKQADVSAGPSASKLPTWSRIPRMSPPHDQH
jgi:hypothetical protein